TGPGARLLQTRLSSPLTDIATINDRLNQVEGFLNAPDLREHLRNRLKSTPDMERALARLSLGRGGPRDLIMIREGLNAAADIRALLQTNETARGIYAKALQTLAEDPLLSEFQDTLSSALAEDPPALARDGGFIAHGYDKRLDELKMLSSESKRLIAGLQSQYQKDTGIDTLKIKFNNVLGYFIEVPAKRGDAMMNNTAYIHRQTMANAVRFTTTQLAELERDISSAGEKTLAIELKIFDELTAQTIAFADEIGARARAIASLDVAAALAELAADLGYTRPVIDDSVAFDIKAARHPVVEAALKKDSETFVPNDCNLAADQRLWLLTGPNMAGKSTYLRQNALIAILAQTGSFVPAASAHIGVIDRVFSRVGASDDLARGRSTFMVEMIEAATILNQATQKSL
ncbi:MAG: DNA mismatch repair protein MutS, partial [Bdellovibrionales bacterium]